MSEQLSSMKLLAQDMRECSITMTQLGKIEYLDSTPTLLQLTGKFLRGLHQSWGDGVGIIMEEGRKPVFKDLLDLVERRIFAMDNVFCTFVSNTNHTYSQKPPLNHQYHRVSAVVTSQLPACSWCRNKNHGLGSCNGFAGATLLEQKDFIC